MNGDPIKDLERLVEARKKATAGPWKWNVNRKYKQCHLEGTPAEGCEYVMDFVRWGMGGSAPRFRTPAGVMQRADELSVVVRHREHHENWYRTIEHPDARFIALAGSVDLPALLAHVKAMEKVREAAKVLASKAERKKGTTAQWIVWNSELTPLDEALSLLDGKGAEPPTKEPDDVMDVGDQSWCLDPDMGSK